MPIWMPWLIAAGVIVLVVLVTLLRRRRGYDLVTPPPVASQDRGRAAGPEALSPKVERQVKDRLRELPPEIERQVTDLLRAGKAIEAIKLVRSAADCGLAEAKDFVDARRSSVTAARSTVPVTRRPAEPIALPPEIDRQIGDLLRAGRTIEAIKVVRETANCGLKEAKDFVDARR